MRTKYVDCRLFYTRPDWDGIYRTPIYRWITTEPVVDISLQIFGVFPQMTGRPGAHKADLVYSMARPQAGVVQPTPRATNAR